MTVLKFLRTPPLVLSAHLFFWLDPLKRACRVLTPLAARLLQSAFGRVRSASFLALSQDAIGCVRSAGCSALWQNAFGCVELVSCRQVSGWRRPVRARADFYWNLALSASSTLAAVTVLTVPRVQKKKTQVRLLPPAHSTQLVLLSPICTCSKRLKAGNAP